MDLQTIIVGIVIALAFAWVIRKVVRSFSGCDTSYCTDCEKKGCPYRRKK